MTIFTMADALYIHIPFCPRKCLYCDFYSVAFDERSAGLYVKALRHELELRPAEAETLKTVFIGGGTPTVLSLEHFSGIFKCIRDNYYLDEEAEITVEANPGTIDAGKIGGLTALGVNRVSMGAQSLCAEELLALGRIHGPEDVSAAARILRESGIENFSIDLIYGIPGQTDRTWLDTLRKTADMSPAHISAYELTPEKDTPLFRMIGEGRTSMPEDDLVVSMYETAMDFLPSQGYFQYEISNYSRKGRECRHNLNYWNRGEYIGAGAGAHSFIGERRTKNYADIVKYREMLGRGAMPVAEVENCTHDIEVSETIFLGLRKNEGIKISFFEANFKDFVLSECELVREGLLEISGDRLRLTVRGRIIANSVVVKLFELLRI